MLREVGLGGWVAWLRGVSTRYGSRSVVRQVAVEVTAACGLQITGPYRVCCEASVIPSVAEYHLLSRRGGVTLWRDGPEQPKTAL